MSFQCSQVQGINVLKITQQKVDASNAPTLKKDILAASQAFHNLVIELSEVRFMDSSGVGVLLACLRHCTEHGGKLKLAGATGMVRQLCTMVKLDRMVPMFPTAPEAIDSFSPPTD